MDFSNFYTEIAKRRNVLVNDLVVCAGDDAIQLGEGMSHIDVLPIKGLSFQLKNVGQCAFNKSELKEAFKLGSAQGCKALLAKLRWMQTQFHHTRNTNWDILIVNGAQDGLNKTIETFLEIGDPIFVQNPSYFGVTEIVAPLLPEFIGIDQDANGIIPEKIEEICAERVRTGKPMPKLLYVNPTGANPTGTCLTESRRHKIYKLAQKYDFLIIEDDPYYFINFLPHTPPSFFELDTDGRVIRLDSFSKILSAGIRLGVVTADKSIIQKLTVHMEHTTMHASSLSQMLLYKLLDTWGIQKFKHHCEEIKQFYQNRRDIMLASIEKHLTGLAEWNVPQGGMFFWVKITALDDVMELATKKCVPEGVLVLPGHAFNYDMTKPERHLRFSYSYATPEEMDKALEIVAKLIREEAIKRNSIK